MSHESEIRDRATGKKLTITPNARVPLYFVLTIISCTIYLVSNLDSKLNDIESKLNAALTQSQFQHWNDIFRDENPTIYVPPIPEKNDSSKATIKQPGEFVEDEKLIK